MEMSIRQLGPGSAAQKPAEAVIQAEEMACTRNLAKGKAEVSSKALARPG